MSDRWYYRTLGQEFGPVTQDALHNLIRSGTLSLDDEVCGEGGRWMSIGHSQFAGSPEASSTRVTGPSPGTPGPLPPRDSSGQRCGPSNPAFLQILTEYRQYLDARNARHSKRQRRDRRFVLTGIPHSLRAAARMPFDAIHAVLDTAASVFASVLHLTARLARSKVVWRLIAAVALAAISYQIARSWAWERQTYNFLTVTAAELRQLRENKADDARWERFARQAQSELAELVPTLEQRAKTDDPDSMEYLWLARDYLPKMLIDARHVPSDSERQFEIHLLRIDEALKRQPSLSLWPSDPTEIGLTLGGLALLVAAASYWRSSRRVG